MLYLSLTCYINRAAARHTPCHWPLPSYPDRSTGHTAATSNENISYRPHTNQCFNQPLYIYTSFSYSFSCLCFLQITILGRMQVQFQQENDLICAWDWCMNNKTRFCTDWCYVMFTVSPVADGSRWNKIQNAAWWLTSVSDTSHGAFCFLKFGLNIKVGA